MRTALLASLLFISELVSAQVRRIQAVRREEPLVLVNDTETDLKHLVLNPGNIEKLHVLKDSSVVATYGDKARHGVLLIVLKPKITLSKLDAVLNQFNIAEPDRKLKVCIDKILVKDTAKILVDPSEVSRIEITTERVLNYSFEEYTGEKYINIITRQPGEKR